MLFDKLRNLLTTGLSLLAEELQNLLNVERIIIRLVIQVLIELPYQDCDVFCRVHTLGYHPSINFFLRKLTAASLEI